MASTTEDGSKKRKHEAVSPPPLKRKVQSTTTKSSVSAFFTPISQKEPDRTSWSTVKDSLLVAHYSTAVVPSNTTTADNSNKRLKIAAFDLDSTLITTSSGNKFAKSAEDWKWWTATVPNTLRDLNAAGYQLIIFTNQGGLSLRKDSKTARMDAKRVSDFKAKTSAVLRQLDVPVNVYAATEKDVFRKPRLGMWREMLNDYNLEGLINMQGSLFVGDAGGRLKSDGLGGSDFSTSDRDFASNAGVAFHTPEEYFLGHKPRAFSRTFNPTEYLQLKKDIKPFTRNGNGQQIVLLCGSPGSGKSTFYWRHLEPLGYQRINQDLLKTRERCLSRAKELLAEGQSVAIDNTNADAETRAHWVRLGHEFEDVKVRCIRLLADAHLAQHNDAVRALNGELMNPEKRTMLPGVAFASFAARFREPRLEEGFSDITHVEFAFDGTTEQKEVWSKYWT